MNAVGNHIRRLRRQRKFSQQALAEKLNVTQETVSQWEDGSIQPDMGILARIAEALGVDILEVIYGEKQGETSCPAIPRKWYWIGFIGFGLLTIALWVLLIQLQPTGWHDLEWKFPVWWYLLQYVVPLFYMLIPISVLSGCSLLWDIRIRNGFIRLVVLLLTLALVGFYYGSSLIFYWSEVNIPNLIWDMFIYTTKNPAIFMLSGIGLFFGLNGRRQQKSADDLTQ